MSALGGGGGMAGFVEQVAAGGSFVLRVETGESELVLSWDGVAGAQFYRVWCGLSPDGLQLAADAVLDTSYAIPGLAAGLYYLQVTAVKSVRESLPSVSDDGSGVLVSSQSLAVALGAPVVVDLLWSAVQGPGTISGNAALASLPAAPQYSSLVYSTPMAADAPRAYLEILVVNAQLYGQTDQTLTFAGVVDGDPGSGPRTGLMWMTVNGTPGLYFNAANDGIQQLMMDLTNLLPDFYARVGLVVDRPQGKVWVSYNGQFWDSASQAFKSSYTDCVGATLQAGAGVAELVVDNPGAT